MDYDFLCILVLIRIRNEFRDPENNKLETRNDICMSNSFGQSYHLCGGHIRRHL